MHLLLVDYSVTFLCLSSRWLYIHMMSKLLCSYEDDNNKKLKFCCVATSMAAHLNNSKYYF